LSKTVILRSALLPFDAHDIYDLVNDIAAYPLDMDGCVGAEVLVVGDNEVLARLDLAKAGVKQSFTTRNSLVPGRAIIMALETGPFEDFAGNWTFETLGASACKVSLDLHFSMPGRLASGAVRRLFQVVSGNLVDALCKRANKIYGG
jgi:ribosome-associated toxin RatA of RatAB toxin-antitoxin module